jgi:hypothetical protein
VAAAKITLDFLLAARLRGTIAAAEEYKGKR